MQDSTQQYNTPQLEVSTMPIRANKEQNNITQVKTTNYKTQQYKTLFIEGEKK